MALLIEASFYILQSESSESAQCAMLTRKKQQARSNRRHRVENEETAQNRLTRMALYDTEVEEEEVGPPALLDLLLLPV